MIGKVNVSGGNSIRGLKIYQQTDEPHEKNGIWIKTEKKNKILKFIFYNKVVNGQNAIYQGTIIIIDDNIYLIGGKSLNALYKYNINSHEFTDLESIPYVFNGSSAVVIGTNIYIIGGYLDDKYEATKQMYKYDTINNTYTQLLDTIRPFGYRCSSCTRY